jgi:hypothetical protein
MFRGLGSDMLYILLYSPVIVKWHPSHTRFPESYIRLVSVPRKRVRSLACDRALATRLAIA